MASQSVIRPDFLLVIIIAGFCEVILVAVFPFPVAAAKPNLLLSSHFPAAAAAIPAVPSVASAAPPVQRRLLLSPQTGPRQPERRYMAVAPAALSPSVAAANAAATAASSASVLALQPECKFVVFLPSSALIIHGDVVIVGGDLADKV